MTIQCCVCNAIIGNREPFEDHRVTHSYCDTCLAAAIQDLHERFPVEIKDTDKTP